MTETMSIVIVLTLLSIACGCFTLGCMELASKWSQALERLVKEDADKIK